MPNKKLKDNFIEFARSIYKEDFVPLHRPVFNGNEKKYLIDAVDSNFVSSAGERVSDFENLVASYTKTKYAVATVNGTSALHIALKMAGVQKNDEVLTQALTFVATCNALSYIDALPVFIDVDLDTMGMSPKSLEEFLDKNVEIKNGIPINKNSGRKISACLPMHTYGMPCRIQEINEICKKFLIPVVEDAAESLGSFFNKKHTGTFGIVAAISFNGNKIITTGGGGMIITNNKKIAIAAKHITTTSKIPHPYMFYHDEIGYNYRLPNINAALGCAQMEQLDTFLKSKKKIHLAWKNFFAEYDIGFINEIDGAVSNHWLNVILFENIKMRNDFLEYTNKNKVMTRPAWEIMNNLPAFKNAESDSLKNTKWLADRLVNIPSSSP